MINTKFYSTFDLVEAASMATLGHVISSIGRDNPDKVRFEIQNDEYLEKDLKKFWSKELRLEPTAFAFNLKLLKGRIRGNY